MNWWKERKNIFNDKGTKLYVPPDQVQSVIKHFHQEGANKHHGWARTFNLLKLKYAGISEEMVRQFCRKCDVCVSFTKVTCGFFFFCSFSFHCSSFLGRNLDWNRYSHVVWWIGSRSISKSLPCMPMTMMGTTTCWQWLTISLDFPGPFLFSTKQPMKLPTIWLICFSSMALRGMKLKLMSSFFLNF